MFLNKLKPENQERFLHLACILCYVDGNYSESERQMIRLYAAEIGFDDGELIIGNVEAEEAKHAQEGEKDFQLAYRFRSVIEEVKEDSDMQERKILLFELLGLAFADKDFSESENKLIKDAHEALEFKADSFSRYQDRDHFFDITEVQDMFTQYIELQKEMTRYVLG